MCPGFVVSVFSFLVISLNKSGDFTMINVVLVDDHTIVRSGFAQLLSLEEDIQVVGQFSSAQEARKMLPGSQAQVCILDISMPDESAWLRN